jgi:hypothetical protein
MFIKYYFHIISAEEEREYDYEGYFTDPMEADQFICENEAVGNTLTIISPFFEMVAERPGD